MNAQAILDKIGLDAQETAQRIAEEAKARCDQLKAASRTKIEAQHAAMLAQAQRDSDELAQVDQTMLLDDRNWLKERIGYLV